MIFCGKILLQNGNYISKRIEISVIIWYNREVICVLMHKREKL
jgi:hypothetical protein